MSDSESGSCTEPEPEPPDAPSIRVGLRSSGRRTAGAAERFFVPENQRTSAVVLAAGEGTRMRSDTPKVLHAVGGKPMLTHVLEALACVTPMPRPVVVVVGKASERVEASAMSTAPEGMGERLAFATQHERLGTAHACEQARTLCAGRGHNVLVLYGDVPLLTATTLSRLLEQHTASGAAVTLLTADVEDASGYGRIIRGSDGDVVRIVEHKHTTSTERQITEINAGVYALDDAWLWPALETLEPSSSGEIYLTDLVHTAVAEGLRVVGVLVDDPSEVAGVNTVDELAQVESVLAAREAAPESDPVQTNGDRGLSA